MKTLYFGASSSYCTYSDDNSISIDQSFLTSEPEVCYTSVLEDLAAMSKMAEAVQRNGILVEDDDARDHCQKTRNRSPNSKWQKKWESQGYSVKASLHREPHHERIPLKSDTPRNGKQWRKKQPQIAFSAAAKPTAEKKKRQKCARSKDGCWTCRLRHKACPEDGVPCSACKRLNLQCDSSNSRPQYMIDADLTESKLREIRQITNRGRWPLRQSRIKTRR